MAKRDKPPVLLDTSVLFHPFLFIWYEYNEHVREGHEYTVTIKDQDGNPLHEFSSSAIIDRDSLVILIASTIAKDPHFGFGRDQVAYRWSESRWVNVDKWLRSLDFSMHAYAHTGHMKRDSRSLTAVALAAWRSIPDAPLEGLDLRPFGRCRGIPFSDCVVTDMGPKRQHELSRHKPENLNTRVLPTTYKAAMAALAKIDSGAADDSLLMRFLHASLEEDELELIQTWFGYHLLTTVVPNAEKMLYLWGSGGNGKGQILWLIRALVGADACAELQLSDLAIEANLEQLVGALAMLGGEASTKTEMETLKSLVSREPMTCNPKYRDPFKFTPTCLVTQSSNWAPAFTERSEALVRRVISLELKRSFKGDDVKIEDIAHQVVANEYDLLAGFALGGAYKVMETGRFTVPASTQASSAAVVASGNPYETFGARTEFGPYEVSEVELYAVYKRWCTEESDHKPDSKREFLVNVQALAKKAKAEILLGQRNPNYTLSRWLDKNGLNVLVAPELEGTKRPVTIRGLRVLDGAGREIGQAIPAAKKPNPLRAA